jgi:ElaB/YqjD/DUF883 family membrane-anchored ribosome-binding protein
MGELRRNELQTPAPEIRASAPQRGVEALEQGLAAGREWARKATQRSLDWIEGHPGQALLIAVGAGFLLGQILFRRGRPVEEDLDD